MVVDKKLVVEEMSKKGYVVSLENNIPMFDIQAKTDREFVKKESVIAKELKGMGYLATYGCRRKSGEYEERLQQHDCDD